MVDNPFTNRSKENRELVLPRANERELSLQRGYTITQSVNFGNEHLRAGIQRQVRPVIGDGRRRIRFITNR